MTVQEFVDYVRNIHNASADSNWSDSEIYKLLQARSNEALSLIGLVEAKTTVTSVIGTQAIAYPTDYIIIRRVLYNGIALRQMTFREWEARRVSGIDPSGLPREFATWNNTIYLIPIPSTAGDTITIYGEKQQSSITAISSTIDTPEVLHGRLADGVIGMMYAKDLNSQMASFFESKWTNVHIPAFREYKNRRRQSYGPILTADSDSSLNDDFGTI